MTEQPDTAGPRIGAEVAEALAQGRAVVALESSIIAHGFPRPGNLTLAEEVEAAVRAQGAVPATVAVLHGIVRIGLSAPELEVLATAEGVMKCSSRDLPWAAAIGAHGGTTVAATCRIAHLAGIRVFATGGIGGVHRPIGAGAPLDISADLAELGRTPMAVVCSGAKSILDLPATMEMLETLGVSVIGFGTDEFPAFHTARSNLALRHRADTPGQVAVALAAQRALGLAGAMLVCNPPPAAVAMDADELEALLARALAEAEAAGVRGGAVTPWLLAALDRLSGGRSREVNRALVLSNAGLAARIAVAAAET